MKYNKHTHKRIKFHSVRENNTYNTYRHIYMYMCICIYHRMGREIGSDLGNISGESLTEIEEEPTGKVA